MIQTKAIHHYVIYLNNHRYNDQKPINSSQQITIDESKRKVAYIHREDIGRTISSKTWLEKPKLI